MTIRQSIIKKLDSQTVVNGLYNQLKQCLEFDLDKIPSSSDTDGCIDLWFRGIIKSLYYNPNNLVLVLEGSQTTFFEDLAEPFSHKQDATIYSELIINTEFTKYNLSLPLKDCFTTELGEWPCDKRLASYCCTTNKWNFPQRKNFIVVPVKGVNQEFFNSIPKIPLWSEIFKMYVND